MTALVPDRFRELVSGHDPHGGITGEAWLRRLPDLVRECLAEWDLQTEGPSMHGVAALVLPVRRAGEPAVLKVTWPHREATHEHLALRCWAGRGSVRLLAADPARWAMLLERLDAGHDLHHEPIDDACGVTGDLLRILDRPALPQLDRLSTWAARQVDELADPPAGIPRRLVAQARDLARDLVDFPDVDARLVHADLHYGNILAARRSPWLAIDPKPMAAEPAFAVAPALWNRWEEAVAGGDLRRSLRRRLAIVCEHGGIDADRARAWTVVREVDNALDAAAGPLGQERVTTAVAIIKAMNG